MENKNIELTNDVRELSEWIEALEMNRITDVETQWKQLSVQISRLRFREKTLRFVRNAAAVLLLPVIIGSLFFVHSKSGKNINPAQIELAVAHGQTGKIILPDQSEVWLNSGSKLTYPQIFTENRRVVHLSGEAYFKVSADKEHRFDVITPDGNIVSAYGTEFNVNAYDNNARTEITLASGQIEVFSPGQKASRILQTPGQQALYLNPAKTEKAIPASPAPSAPQINISNVSVYEKTAWIEGKLVFRRTSLLDIAERLSRHFNVNIEIQDEELSRHEYSATFTNESISEILALLEKSTPIICEITEPEKGYDHIYSPRKVVIKKKNR